MDSHNPFRHSSAGPVTSNDSSGPGIRLSSSPSGPGEKDDFRHTLSTHPRGQHWGSLYRFLGDVDDILALLERDPMSLSMAPPSCPSHKETLAKLMALQESVEQAELAVIRDTLDLMKATEPSVLRALVFQNVSRSIAWCKMHDEEVAMCWETDMERNLEKETADLQMILQSDPHGSHTWTSRSGGPVSTFRVSRDASNLSLV